MTLLSFIAITASVLAYIVWVLSKGMSWIISAESTSAWKHTLWKVGRWFELDLAPLWRRILLKVLLSILILTSLGCGFWSIVSIAPENRTIWRILLGILMTAFSFIVIIGICAVAHNFTDALSFDYFNLRDSQKSYTSQNRKIIAINSTILFLWVIFLSAESVWKMTGKSLPGCHCL